MNMWDRNNVESILVQLNNMNYPFEKYEFTSLNNGLDIIGEGASATVYKAVRKGEVTGSYAIKVIGFGKKHAESDAFWESVIAQSDVQENVKNVVKIYEAKELLVWIEDDNKVVEVQEIKYNEDIDWRNLYGNNCIQLQFVVMEELLPVITLDEKKMEQIDIRLSFYSEKEIIKFFYDIAEVINNSHLKNILHRDIKLENVFYDSNINEYKLGDFGIARYSDDGMASTVAFTKGYGAPEIVGSFEEKYDCTADIYSLGMMIYILLNDGKFPDSQRYYPNINQYSKGYVPPKPVNGSDDLIKIVLKMLSYNSNDRYQSMDAVLNDLDKIKYGYWLKYQREHKKSSLILGMIFASIGILSWYTIFEKDALNVSIIEYLVYVVYIIFLIVGIRNVNIKRNKFLVIIYIVGILSFVFIRTSWFKILLFLLFLFVPKKKWDIRLSIISSNIIYSMLALFNVIIVGNASNIQNIEFVSNMTFALIFTSLSWVLFHLNVVQNARDEKSINSVLRNKGIMIFYSIFYYFVYKFGFSCVLCDTTYGQSFIADWRLDYVGIAGMIFCIGWTIREIFFTVVMGIKEKRNM